MSVAVPLQVASRKAERSSFLVGGRLLHRKLTIGTSNDPFEQEADRVADQMVVAPGQSEISSAKPHIQRLSGHPAMQLDTAPASVCQALANPGIPLEKVARQDMEQRFGYDFSQVRVHSGTVAGKSALDVNANAYTVGHNMVFGTGKYVPGTRQGRWLIAHELAHVMQQVGASCTHFGPSSTKRILYPHSVPPLREVIQRDQSTTSRQVEVPMREQSFEDALREGAQLFFSREGEGLEFGSVVASYDTAKWQCVTPKTIRARVTPNEAMESLIDDIRDKRTITVGDRTVPIWSVDCLNFARLIRVYAYWKTMDSDEFNRKFNPLELGATPQTNFYWMQGSRFEASRPEEGPKVVTWTAGAVGEEVQPRYVLGHSWSELLSVAPVGSLVRWDNRHLTQECRTGNRHKYNCNWAAEWATKLGPDQYAAWNAGILNETTIKRDMAQRGLGLASATEIPSSYIARNIFVGTVKLPEQFGEHEYFKLTSAVDVWGVWEKYMKKDSGLSE